MNNLIGRTITDFYYDDSYAYFKCSDVVLKYEVYSECCSESWIESVEDGDNMLNSPVLDIIEFLDQDMDSPSPEFDYLIYSNYIIVTAKGECKIEFRNDSNGYYSGELLYRDKYDVSEWSSLMC